MSAEEYIFTKDDIRSVAQKQSIIRIFFFSFLILFLAELALGVLQISVSYAFVFSLIGLEIGCRIVAIPFVHQLATSMKESRPWFYVVGMFFPMLHLFAIAYLIQKAAKVLRANTIRVTLLGYEKEDLERFLK